MGDQTPLGIALRGKRPHGLRRILAVLTFVCATATSAAAGERYALVVTGASGGDQYAQQYDAWRTSFVSILRESWNYPDAHVYVLAEKDSAGVGQATRENV